MRNLDDELLNLLGSTLNLIGQTEDQALYKSHFSDLSRSEMQTLYTVGPYDALSMSETAEKLGVTVGSLSVQVDRLVKKDYLNKKKRPDDRRVNELTLTRKGKIAVRVRTKFISQLLQYILEPLDKDEQIVLSDTLSRIEEYLDDKYAEYKNREISDE